MTDLSVASMRKKRSIRPVIAPTLTVLLMMIAAKLVYNLSWWEIWPAAHQTVTFISGLVLSACLVFGSSLVYPLARFRGSGIKTAIVGCLTTPVVWNIWEIIRVSDFFSPAVALYYGSNSLFLGAVAFGIFQMGAWETIYRLSSKHRFEIRGPAGPMCAAVIGLGMVGIINFWGMGAHWFYLWGQGYKLLLH